MHWFSTTQHTQSCRLTVTIHLKTPSSSQTVKSGIDHRTCNKQANHSPNSIRQSGSSSFMQAAIFVYGFHTSQATKCDKHWFYGRQSHKNITFVTSLETVWRPVSLSAVFLC
jgi:hypothetical protein